VGGQLHDCRRGGGAAGKAIAPSKNNLNCRKTQNLFVQKMFVQECKKVGIKTPFWENFWGNCIFDYVPTISAVGNLQIGY